MPLSSVQGTYTTAAETTAGQGTLAEGAANLLYGTASDLNDNAGELGDKKVKTNQTGAGFTPMIGVHISPSENLDIAVKYEMKTILKLTNDTEVDDLGLFPDGVETRNDIPAILGIGIGYRPAEWLEAQLSYTGYFNKGVDWGNNTRYLAGGTMVQREIDKNGYELGLGLQFNLSEKFAVSVGGLVWRYGSS